MQYLDQMPAYLVKHVDGIKSPSGDGHCGYRCAVWALALEQPDGQYAGEVGWYEVRKDLLKELADHREVLYDRMFGRDFDKIVSSIRCEPGMECPRSKWMNMIDVGSPLANYYNRLIIILDHQDVGRNRTFLPQHIGPLEGQDIKPIVLAFVDGNHWVWVKLKGLDGKLAPYPPILGGLKRLKGGAVGWKEAVEGNLREWDGLALPRKKKGKGAQVYIDTSESECDDLEKRKGNEAVEGQGQAKGKRSSRNKSLIFTSYKNL